VVPFRIDIDGCPAETAGFKVGDMIAMIDEKTATSWSETAFDQLRYSAEGTPASFIMQNGSARSVKLADYF
jgi:C-terminal processing protease CtpA/Prc